MNKSGHFIRELLGKDRNAEKFSRRLLPAPPDVRKVVLQEDDMQPKACSSSQDITCMVSSLMTQLSSWQKSIKAGTLKMEVTNAAREIISPSNTTIIGDYIASCYQAHDNKWLVQVAGNDTLQSIAWKIQHDLIDVQKRYIFIIAGHNQLWTATKGTVIDAVAEIVDEIRCRNAAARVYFSALLPRPIDNSQAKPRIIKLNRSMFQAVQKAQKKYTKVQFLAVQHEFIKQSMPDLHMYREDKMTLNEVGARTLKDALFNCAGFRMNVK